MSRFNEYLEAAKSAYASKGDKPDLKQKIKDFLNTTIGRLKGWKITIVDDSGKEEPIVSGFDASAMRNFKKGEMIIPAKDYEALKAGEVIKPHEIVDIDPEQRIVKIKRNYRSTMFMPKDWPSKEKK